MRDILDKKSGAVILVDGKKLSLVYSALIKEPHMCFKLYLTQHLLVKSFRGIHVFQILYVRI